MRAVTPITIDEITHLSEEGRQALRDLVISDSAKPILCRWCYKAFVVPNGFSHPPPHLYLGVHCSGNLMDYLGLEADEDSKRCTSAFKLLARELGLEGAEQEGLYGATAEYLEEFVRVARDVDERAFYIPDIAEHLAADLTWGAATRKGLKSLTKELGQEDLYEAMTGCLEELGRLLKRIGEQEDRYIREKALYTRDLADRLASDFAWIAARTGSNYDYARTHFASLLSRLEKTS